MNARYVLCCALLVSSVSMAMGDTSPKQDNTLLFGIPPTLANFTPVPIAETAELDVRVNALINANSDGGLMDVDVPRLDTAHTYHKAWSYSLEADGFSGHAWRQARLVSNDYNVSLLISYGKQDKQLKSPSVFLLFSGDWDNGVHSPMCDSHCTLDMTINGQKFPNTGMKAAGMDILQFDAPHSIVNQLKTAYDIKIRVQSITGQHLIYGFNPNGGLELSQLR